MSKSKILVVGSSTLVASALSKRKDTYFIGRTNPFSFDNYFEGLDLNKKENIDHQLSVITEILNNLPDCEDVHLVHLQGISSTNWEECINVNMLSVALFSELFCEWVIQNKKTGSITMIGSASAYLGGKVTYASTKSSLFGIMNALNSRYGKTIRSNIVLPGAFEGGMTNDWDNIKLEMIAEKTFAGRIATPEEISKTILSSIDNEYLCGAVINMTSGQVNIQ